MKFIIGPASFCEIHRHFVEDQLLVVDAKDHQDALRQALARSPGILKDEACDLIFAEPYTYENAMMYGLPTPPFTLR